MSHKLLLIIGVISLLSLEKVMAEEYAENMRCGIYAKATWTSQVDIGSAIPWTICLSNNSSTIYVCDLSLGIDAVGADGSSWGYIYTSTSSLTLVGSANTNVSFFIPANLYGAKPNAIYRGTAAVEVHGTNEIFIREGFTELYASSNALSINPEQGLKVGDSVTCDFSFINPYSFALTGVVVTIKGKSIFAPEQESSFPLGTVMASQVVHVSTNLITTKAGTGTIFAGITATNLSVFTFRRTVQAAPQ